MKDCTGQAAASPNAQTVRPSIWLAIDKSKSASSFGHLLAHAASHFTHPLDTFTAGGTLAATSCVERINIGEGLHNVRGVIHYYDSSELDIEPAAAGPSKSRGMSHMLQSNSVPSFSFPENRSSALSTFADDHRV